MPAKKRLPRRRAGKSPKNRGAELLRLWREGKGLTQPQASRLLGFAYDLVGFLERGYRKPGIRAAVKLQDRVGVPIDAWLKPGSAR